MWGLALLHPSRVNAVVNLSLPYQERGERPWVEVMEEALGGDFYFVHFNRRPGVADAVLDESPHRFLRNLFRKDVPLAPPQPGMAMIELARAQTPLGAPLMSQSDLAVFVEAFERTGFTSSINWYRNLDRNWHLLADADPVVRQPALMIYGERDAVVRADRLSEFVPRVDVITLDSGHWIQQERPDEMTRAILAWLAERDAA